MLRAGMPKAPGRVVSAFMAYRLQRIELAHVNTEVDFRGIHTHDRQRMQHLAVAVVCLMTNVPAQADDGRPSEV